MFFKKDFKMYKVLYCDMPMPASKDRDHHFLSAYCVSHTLLSDKAHHCSLRDKALQSEK